MHFQWAWVLVPLVCLLFAWFIHNVEPTGVWMATMDRLGVRDRGHYAHLAMLGLALVALCAVLRFWKANDDS